MPGSALEWPERSTIANSLPGQACASRHAVSSGLLIYQLKDRAAANRYQGGPGLELYRGNCPS